VVSVRPEILPSAPTPPSFAPTQPDETLVIVTQFEDRSQGQKAGIDPAQRIHQALSHELEVTVACLTSPAAGIATVVHKVAEKAKEEAK
jgi:hypothetical protein